METKTPKYSEQLALFSEEGISVRKATMIERYVEHFTQGRVDYAIDALDFDELKEYAAFLGVENLKDREVIYQFLANKVSYCEQIYTDPVTVTDNLSIEAMLNQIADMGMINDYPNDFYAGFVAKLDDKTGIVFGLEQEEIPGICNTCAEGGYESAYHGCGHERDDYLTRPWLMLCELEKINHIDWTRGEIAAQPLRD